LRPQLVQDGLARVCCDRDHPRSRTFFEQPAASKRELGPDRADDDDVRSTLVGQRAKRAAAGRLAYDLDVVVTVKDCPNDLARHRRHVGEKNARRRLHAAILQPRTNDWNESKDSFRI
jgi:hypothetical protein